MGSVNDLSATAESDRLAKICSLFSSDHTGERAAAAWKADAMVRNLGLRWPDVIRLPKRPAPKRPGPAERLAAMFRGGWREAATWCLRYRRLSPADRSFCDAMVQWHNDHPGRSNLARLLTVTRHVCRCLGWYDVLAADPARSSRTRAYARAER